MIDATFLIDITDLVKTELNYLEKTYNFVKGSSEYEVRIRSMVDRSYNTVVNSHKDYYRHVFFIFKNRTYMVFREKEFQVLSLSVDGKNNLKLSEFVGVHYNQNNNRDRDQIIFFHYSL